MWISASNVVARRMERLRLQTSGSNGLFAQKHNIHLSGSVSNDVDCQFGTKIRDMHTPRLNQRFTAPIALQISAKAVIYMVDCYM